MSVLCDPQWLRNLKCDLGKSMGRKLSLSLDGFEHSLFFVYSVSLSGETQCGVAYCIVLIDDPGCCNVMPLRVGLNDQISCA